jgi:hypothetical protein
VCLIAAITAANANGQPNTIRLAGGPYTLTAVDNDTDGPNGLPSITSPLTIRGADGGTTILEREQAAAAFRLVHVAASGNLTLDRVTLRGGAHGEPGGGLFNNAGVVTLTRSTVTKNTASNGAGGLESTGGTVTLTQSTVDGNDSEFSVGGIAQRQGTLRIIQSRITRNSASSGIGGLFASGTVIITRSTIAGNVGSSVGGMDSRSVAQLVNSAVVDNASGGGAGGIENSGLLLITNSTVARNQSPLGSGGLINFGTTVLLNTTIAENDGAGIGVSGGTVTVQNTILARNTSDCGGPSSGSIISLGNNLIGDPNVDICPITPSDLTGDPGLDSFTENGPPGHEHFPLRPTSQAIDAGSDASCPRTDQLGQRRINIPEVGMSLCDIGAIEFQHREN